MTPPLTAYDHAKSVIGRFPGLATDHEQMTRALAELISCQSKIQEDGPTPDLVQRASDSLHTLQNLLCAPTLLVDILRQSYPVAQQFAGKPLCHEDPVS